MLIPDVVIAAGRRRRSLTAVRQAAAETVMRHGDFGEEIAGSEYVFRLPDGSERPVRLRIGRPYANGGNTWACPVELAGFESRYPDIVGEDSLQALSLALALAWRRLQDFVEKGGTVLDGEGHAYSLDELRRILGRY